MLIFDRTFESLVRLAFLLVFAFFAVVAFSVRSDAAKVEKIRDGRIDSMSFAARLDQRGRTAPPQIYISVAEQVSEQDASQDDLAITLLERALEIDDRLPEAHARLAFLKTRQAGRLNSEAAAQLEQSFFDCPYCSRDLLRWRLAFVILHWRDTPEQVRLQAFAGADVLRWWYLDYAFLETISKEASAKGIAFEAYRRKIYTPVRPSEIGQQRP